MFISCNSKPQFRARLQRCQKEHVVLRTALRHGTHLRVEGIGGVGIEVLVATEDTPDDRPATLGEDLCTQPPTQHLAMVAQNVGTPPSDAIHWRSSLGAAFCSVTRAQVGAQDDGVEAGTLFSSLLLLMIMLIAVLLAIMCNGWKLTHRLGWSMFVLWVLFVTHQVLSNMACCKALAPI